MPWQRAADPAFPRVYARLERARGPGPARPAATGGAEAFLVQDLPPEDDERALELLRVSFLRDEDTCKSQDAASDPTCVREMTEFWEKVLAHRTSLACYRVAPAPAPDGGGGRLLVGVNACGVVCRDDPPPDLDRLQSPGWRQILHTMVLASETCDVFERLGVERYLGGSGLVLLPEYRGLGLAAEILRAREPLCRAVGLRATCTVFTALPSQVVAARCGFETLGEVAYGSLAALGYRFPDIRTPSAKVMALKYSWPEDAAAAAAGAE